MNIKRNKICGVGINDYSESISVKGNHIKSYIQWKSMLSRCYDPKMHKIEPSYIKCEVCEEWKLFSNFKKWFDENYVEGYQLDKDILFKGNKIYSQNTCCFVPQEVNKLFTNRKNDRGKLPIGVCYSKKYNKFKSQINIDGERKHLGYFITAKDAYLSYKKAKENIIKQMAVKYFKLGLISLNVYNSMIKYHICIND